MQSIGNIILLVYNPHIIVWAEFECQARISYVVTWVVNDVQAESAYYVRS